MIRNTTSLLLLVAATGCTTANVAFEDDDATAGEPDDSRAAQAPAGETLYAGMGEYNPQQDWHAILRFDEADTLDSSDGYQYSAAATVPIKESTAKDGTAINFAHGLYLDESRDEMYIASIFTSTTVLHNGNPSLDAGSVGIMANMGSADGPQVLSRHIFGDATKLKQPHGVWVDESRDQLYVANTFGMSLLVFDEASSVDGDVAPARTVSHDKLGNPVFVYVDEESDRLFVASMNTAKPDAFPHTRSAINIYNNASTIDGQREPDVQIAGPATRLDEGNNQTTHNVWYDASRQLMLVGHHTNELLIYDMSTVDLSPAQASEYDLVPRVLEIHEQADGSDIGEWSVYGLFLLPDSDRLYVSCGHAQGGPSVGSPPHSIKVYDGLMDSDDSGLVPPTRRIYWDSGDQYYPPQPLWVARY